MAEHNPTFSLHLNGKLSVQLGHAGFTGTTPSLTIEMHDTSDAATLMVPGYSSSTGTFSLPLALQMGLFSLFDTKTNTEISIPSSDEQPGEMVLEAEARSESFDLNVDSRKDFWIQHLTAGHTYEIRWQDTGETPWAYRSNVNQGSRQRLPVHCSALPIKLSVLDDTITSLRISVSLAPTADVCHRSGKPRFGFELQIISHEHDIITICLEKTPLKEFHGLEEIAYVVNEEHEEVEWDIGFGCWEFDDPFPPDNMFEEFKPGVPYQRMFWIEDQNKEMSCGGELSDLEADRIYKVEVSKTLLGAFSKWKKGSKEALLAGGTKEKQERWNYYGGKVILEVSDPFTFKTV